MSAIEVSHVTKEYRLGAIQGLKQALLKSGARLLGKKPEKPPLFKALDDVTFSIDQGEVVGIIGHNGAGKSTLLKMLAKISTPTSGSVKVNGRIAPLIEVGAGFVPDFTGRENVYLNGAILGMSRQEVARKFDEIVDFAEMAEFIDTPVKRYSSGMQVKLAFAVATCCESEILLVDEVLAVGDLAFQRKCFDRMEELIKRQGRTVLLVSHNIRQVRRLCERAVLLDHGRVFADGHSKNICDLFYEQNDAKIKSQLLRGKKSANTLSTGYVDITRVVLLDNLSQITDRLDEGSEISVLLQVTVKSTLIRPVFAVGIHTTDMIYLASDRSESALELEKLEPGSYEIICRLNNFPFLAGVYSLRASVAAGTPRIDHFYGENLFHFQVCAKGDFRSEMSNEGFIALDTDWSIDARTSRVTPTLTPPQTA